MKQLFTLVLTLTLLLPGTAGAADLLIAQAANFMPAMQEIIPAFEAETGLHAEAAYTSTGKLYGQIKNGAPFDVFLSADERRPELLYKEQLAEKPFVYAKGQLVLWSANPELGKIAWKNLVLDSRVEKISIANVETAPYGTAAMIAMKNIGIWDKVQPKLIFAQTIAQVFQYAQTKNTDAGFCAYSSMFSDKAKGGAFTVVEGAPDILQAACILKKSEHRDAAQKFADFMRSDTVQKIKAKYGYK
ncbi:molybdate ABC transporter substrate-binding protein [Desulfobaculum bizertense]|uniref:molybdate ABC transporter substrate-binding protein n=1 Tax=Desulfobaculum bizertense TaxID=376490 RepID=UPI001F412D4C|nr:molybdate ABC transporter substrate-binding protein [Desulfobaculum bizertense]UIJ38208.1 molybdate ABC transporter substrate-binding protein [Desulfobaculum bizertense]